MSVLGTASLQLLPLSRLLKATLMCDAQGSRLQSLPRGNVDPERRASLTDGLDPALEAEQQVGVLVNSYTAALQELMMQLLVHWRVSSAVMVHSQKPVHWWVGVAACTLADRCGCLCRLPLSLAGQTLRSLSVR